MAENTTTDRLYVPKEKRKERMEPINSIPLGRNLPMAIAHKTGEYPDIKTIEKSIFGIRTTEHPATIANNFPPIINQAGQKIAIKGSPPQSSITADIPMYTNISPTGEAGETIYKNGKVWIPKKESVTFADLSPASTPPGAAPAVNPKDAERYAEHEKAVRSLTTNGKTPTGSINITSDLPVPLRPNIISTVPMAASERLDTGRRSGGIGEWFVNRMAQREKAAGERAAVKEKRETEKHEIDIAKGLSEVEKNLTPNEANRVLSETERQYILKQTGLTDKDLPAGFTVGQYEKIYKPFVPTVTEGIDPFTQEPTTRTVNRGKMPGTGLGKIPQF